MLPLLFVLLLLETICWALFEPAQRAVIPNITEGDEIPIANALASATWSVNFALGAGLGGLVLVASGARRCSSSIRFLSSLSALLIRRMKFAEPHAENLPALRARDLVDFSPIAEGVRYVRARSETAGDDFREGRSRADGLELGDSAGAGRARFSRAVGMG